MNQGLLKPAEVCEIASVQPYVLRTWEAEFPDLGVTRSKGNGRLYRKVDLDRVLRIKQLLFVDGLTLAGARRRLEEEADPTASDDEAVDVADVLGEVARDRLASVREGLRGLLALLDGTAEARNGNSSSKRPAKARRTVRS